MRQYNGVKIRMICTHRQVVPYDFLKYFRVVQYWWKDKYNLNQGDLDTLLFLYSEGLFSRQDFNEFTAVCGWDKDRFHRLLKSQWIVVFRERVGREATLYEISAKGKQAVGVFYKKLTGAKIHEVGRLFNKVESYNDIVYRSAIRRMNEANKEKRKERAATKQQQRLDEE